MTITLEWRGRFANVEVNALHAEGFDHAAAEHDWWAQVNRHGLGWVCAREEGTLVGFVNVAWDGSGHAFVLDTLVTAGVRRLGVGTALVAVAVREARAAGCEWLHVDFEDHLRTFYIDSCGFMPTSAGVMALQTITATYGHDIDMYHAPYASDSHWDTDTVRPRSMVGPTEFEPAGSTAGESAKTTGAEGARMPTGVILSVASIQRPLCRQGLEPGDHVTVDPVPNVDADDPLDRMLSRLAGLADPDVLVAMVDVDVVDRRWWATGSAI